MGDIGRRLEREKRKTWVFLSSQSTRGGEKFPRPAAKQLPVGNCFIAAEAKDPSAVSDSDQFMGWVPSGVLAAW